MMRRSTILLAALLLPMPALAAQVDDATALTMIRPQELIVDPHLPRARLAEELKPVDAFYAFWTNGSRRQLDAAIAPSFTDHTLPMGRAQGPAGPAAASDDFLAAIPDLKIAVVQQIVAADRVVSHLRFTGHFTGHFLGRQGSGQPIDFIATDILKVAGRAGAARITDNWHLEDNLTVLQQMGLVPAKIGG